MTTIIELAGIIILLTALALINPLLIAALVGAGLIYWGFRKDKQNAIEKEGSAS